MSDCAFSKELQGEYRINAITLWVLIISWLFLLVLLIYNFQHAVDPILLNLAKFYIPMILLLFVSHRIFWCLQTRVVIQEKSIQIIEQGGKQRLVALADIELISIEGGDMTLFLRDNIKIDLPSFGGMSVARAFLLEIGSMGIEIREFTTS